MDFNNPLVIPPEIIPPGMVYYWGRFSCLGEPDLSRQAELSEKGWTKVPYSRHPEFFSKSISKEHIEMLEGLVLVERPSKLDEIEKSLLEDYRRLAMEEINKEKVKC